MAFFRRSKKSNTPVSKAAIDTLARDGAIKCYAEMSADQHMLGQGCIAMHNQRTEMTLRPGELAAMPSFHVYFSADRSCFLVGLVIVAGNASRDTALGFQKQMIVDLDTTVGSAELGTSIRSAGYVPILIQMDPKKTGDAALSVEEFDPVAAIA